MDTMKIDTRIGSITVHFSDTLGFIKDFQKIPNYFIVADSIVYELYKKEIFQSFPKKNLMVLKSSEDRKTLQVVTDIYRKLLPFPAKKNMVLISFGGGINQDVTGFVASTIYRGIRWIYVPTTLLAMADSAIGLKTSLNFEVYKNMIGSFYAPSDIYIHAGLLKTLGRKEFLSGVGEIIKFYLMRNDPIKNWDDSIKKINKLLHIPIRDTLFMDKTVKESIRIKLSYMLGDELDQGKRNLLNYGHELGHALEPSSSFAIPHGVAVVCGILFANLVSYKRGWLPKKTFIDINEKLLLPFLLLEPTLLKRRYFDQKTILNNLKKDKKRTGKDLPLVLPKKNFELVKITDFTIDEFKTAYRDFIRMVPMN